MTKEQLIQEANNLILREKDFKTLLFLVKSCSPKLFTKIFEEILLGNLYISDFEPIYTTNVSDIIAESIEIQNKIEKQYKNMLSLRESNNRDKFKQEQKIFANILNEEKLSAEVAFQKKNYLSYFLQKMDPRIPKELAIKIYNNFDSNINSLLLETNNYNIPLEMNDIILDIFDYEYMRENNIPEDQMKKIKALANFFNNRGDH